MTTGEWRPAAFAADKPSTIAVLISEPGPRESLLDALNAAGLPAECFDTGVEAFHAAFRRPPAALIADIDAPESDYALRRIRATLDVPIVFIGQAPELFDPETDAEVSRDQLPRAAVRAATRVSGLLVLPANPPEVGERIGDYELECEIGRGGMGIVYRARHVHLQRAVALKVLLPGVAEESSARSQFMQEWRTVAALDHPNIITVHDAGEAGDWLYLAMPLIDGLDFAEQIQRDHPLPSGHILGVLDQAAAALDAAHAADVVHRDFKPANLLLDGDRCLLTDFGIARVAAGAGTAGSTTLGTAGYVAPEQLRGEPVDARTDVYSLGCTMFEAMTGRAPFSDASSLYETMYAHMTAAPPRPTLERPDLPGAVDDVVARAMAKKPDDRYGSAGAAVDALGAAFRGGAHRERFRRVHEAPVGVQTF